MAVDGEIACPPPKIGAGGWLRIYGLWVLATTMASVVAINAGTAVLLPLYNPLRWLARIVALPVLSAAGSEPAFRHRAFIYGLLTWLVLGMTAGVIVGGSSFGRGCGPASDG